MVGNSRGTFLSILKKESCSLSLNTVELCLKEQPYE